jgi:hypothetical protein
MRWWPSHPETAATSPRLGSGVVREVRSGGRFLLALKGRTMVVDGAHMEQAETIGNIKAVLRST